MAIEKAKIIKPKKKFNFATVMKFVRTLWKNDAVVEVATTTKWYWSLIVFVVSLVISVLPTTVTQATTQGRNFLSGTNVNYSDPFINGLYAYLHHENSETSEIIFDKETNKLSSTTNRSTDYGNSYLLSDGTKAPRPLYSYKRTITTTTGSITTSNLLDIYVIYDESETANLNTYIAQIQGTNTNFADGYTQAAEARYTRTTPYILFTNDSFYAVNYSANGSTALNGNYNHILEIFTELGASSTYTFRDVLNYNLPSTSTILDEQNAIFENFLKYCDQVYIDPRFDSTWISFGIYCGVNGSIIILMGLILWLMTRGKNNPNNKIKIWETYSMAFWASTSPAILSLFGFLMPSMGMMIFIMLYAFRAMFLSMRQLRPVYN